MMLIIRVTLVGNALVIINTLTLLKYGIFISNYFLVASFRVIYI